MIIRSATQKTGGVFPNIDVIVSVLCSLHKTSAPLKPPSNGQSERYVATLKQSLTAMQKNMKRDIRARIDLVLPDVKSMAQDRLREDQFADTLAAEDWENSPNIQHGESAENPSSEELNKELESSSVPKMPSTDVSRPVATQSSAPSPERNFFYPSSIRGCDLLFISRITDSSAPSSGQTFFNHLPSVDAVCSSSPHLLSVSPFIRTDFLNHSIRGCASAVHLLASLISQPLHQDRLSFNHLPSVDAVCSSSPASLISQPLHQDRLSFNHLPSVDAVCSSSTNTTLQAVSSSAACCHPDSCSFS
ncbi:hypothetical protein TNIN_237501 [Trichonephila inaurata madagascariensis]|uniref:Uncharacterized protein n=1 Tax=Trichonephila inaurata madagascariensis TaxID=2747483 RepID=A0A8X6YPL9_9ARAC|nr:hypothetical protein TNIN_237501 [Trichonephila inaurata madagascariensis]